MAQRRYYFSTRDLLMMAALAALGGVISTYINAVGDFFQSFLGFAGTTQWAAGLHVVWLVLAVGLTRKQGAGTVAGILKGGVELLSGNTHGLPVVLVNIIAGVLVDLGFMPFRRQENPLAYGLAGGLAAGSNVFVFQLFAALPADVLAYGALALIGGVAFASGVLLGGLLALILIRTLRRAGVVRDQPAVPLDRRIYLGLLGLAVVVAAGLGLYLHLALGGPDAVRVDGQVAAPYDYPRQHGDIPQVTAAGTLQGVTTRYTGTPVREIVARAGPAPTAALLLVRGADGYAFFIGMDEVQESASLLLAAKGSGRSAAYDVVGAANSKAWVRDVASLTVVGAARLEMSGALEQPVPFDPAAWQFQMDSTALDVGHGRQKYQGVPLGLVLEALAPQDGAATVALYAPGATEPALALPLNQVLADKDLRIFTIMSATDVSFALARMGGEVLLPRLGRVEVR